MGNLLKTQTLYLLHTCTHANKVHSPENASFARICNVKSCGAASRGIRKWDLKSSRTAPVTYPPRGKVLSSFAILYLNTQILACRWFEKGLTSLFSSTICQKDPTWVDHFGAILENIKILTAPRFRPSAKCNLRSSYSSGKWKATNHNPTGGGGIL